MSSTGGWCFFFFFFFFYNFYFLILLQSEAQELTIVKMSKFGGGIGAPSKEERLKEAADIHLRLGQIQRYCELMVELGQVYRKQHVLLCWHWSSVWLTLFWYLFESLFWLLFLLWLYTRCVRCKCLFTKLSKKDLSDLKTLTLYQYIHCGSALMEADDPASCSGYRTQKHIWKLDRIQLHETAAHPVVRCRWAWGGHGQYHLGHLSAAIKAVLSAFYHHMDMVLMTLLKIKRVLCLFQWEKALAVAPGVSMRYWKKLMQR